MRASILAVTALGFASTVFASESRMESALKKRIPAAGGPTDVEILNYALTLEYLERDFYAEGLAKFDNAAFNKAGFPSYVRDRFVLIGDQEKSHVSFLATALGDAGVGECTYNFGLTDVKTFLTISRILEGVGTSAYLGAAPDITSAAYLAAAGAILTVEARHTAFLLEETGSVAFPGPYETALKYSQVYSLASPFIVSCSKSGALPPGIMAYPKLTVKTAAPKAGKKVGLNFKIPAGYSGPYYAAFLNGLTTTYAEIDPKHGIATVPAALKGAGTTYLIITKDQATIADGNTIAGPAVLLL